MNNKLWIHISSDFFLVFKKENDVPFELTRKYHKISSDSIIQKDFQELDKLLYDLSIFTEKIDTEHVKIYATGMFQDLSGEIKEQLIVHVYVYHGLYFNIISSDLEQFYLSQNESCNNLAMINGLFKQEFRNVVVCGSFKHSIKEIEFIISKLKKSHVNILSPTTTKLRPETIGTEFVLFEGQELVNERDAWRHQNLHIWQFYKSDAVIFCNPKGIVGKSALFELGYLTAISKRIIFTEVPSDLPIMFPYEVGLNI